MNTSEIDRNITERKQAERALRESEDKFLKVLDFTPTPVAVAKSNGDLVFLNKHFVNTYGYTLQDLTTIEKWFHLAYPDIEYRNFVLNDWGNKVADALKNNVATGATAYQATCKNGDIKTVEISAYFEKDYSIGLFQDVTERNRVEDALKRSKDLLAETEHIGKVGGWSFNIDTMKQTWTDEVYRIHEVEISSNPSVERGINFYTAESRPIIEKAVQRAIEFGEEFDLDLEIITAKGNPRAVHTIGKADFKNRRIYGFFQDITERKRADAKLADSHQRLECALQGGGLGIWDWNPQNGEVVYSDFWAQMLEYRPDEIEPTVDFFKRHVHPEDLPTVLDRLTGHVEGHMPTYESEHRMRTRSGRLLWVMDRGKTAKRDKDGSPVRVTGIIADITERKRVEGELKKRNIFIESILANMPIGFAVNTIDDGDVKYMNKKFEEIYGWSRDILSNVTIFFEKVFPYPEHRAVMKEKIISDMQSGDPERMKWDNLKIVTSTNEERYVNAINIPLSDQNMMISTVQDMTERKRMEEELQKAQKLESLGLLAGGIAHDFNNLMGGIFGYIDMAIEETKEVKVTSYLSKAMNTIERARALTGQLLTFAKGGAPIQKIDHLFPFVEETARFALSGANVSCHFDVQQDLWACNFDKNQIGQVIDNLIINAQQAMPVGGTIELTARNITLSEKEHPLLKNGNYVKISIKDTGIGISKELITRIFDPFFTTKAKGHGLGLATSYSIINRHGGCIDVESEPGKGSTFKVYLPASTEATSSVNENAVKMHRGNGTFLIMDDEEVMRDTIKDMLESLGYSVVSKENGQDAIDFFASEIESKREIVGMIFDLTVPGGLGGKAAIEEIRKTNTDIPVFVASGYTDDLVMKNPADHGFTASICKPFRKSELSEMLNTFMKPKK